MPEKNSGKTCPASGKKCNTPITCGNFGICVRKDMPETPVKGKGKPGTTGTFKPGS